MSDQITSFRGMVIREEGGQFKRSIEDRQIGDLPDYPVLIRVHYAGLNYKDGLSGRGHKGITKEYPHQPGIDAAGVVVSDGTGEFVPGQKVICTSFDLGMNTDGGFGEYIKVPAQWVVPLPDGMSLKDSMVHGSAGYTAGLALHKMMLCEQSPEMGPICVTGATGGVGSLAVAILSKAGFEVIASTGDKSSHEFLTSLGATEIIGRDEVTDQSGRPLLRSKWAGAIDNVGGNTLATLLKCCGKNGSVACIGLVASDKIDMTVYPFILNGVNLLGIDSANTPRALRESIWKKLAGEWKPKLPDGLCTEIGLDELDEYLSLIIEGKTRGRVVVKHAQ
jgi:acrylyl-CoA reductase (NADPH)